MAQSAADPQTDRELLLNLHSKVHSIQLVFDGKIDRLTESIDRLNDTYRELEEKKVVVLEERVEEILTWKNQISGGWKFAVAIWMVLTVTVEIVLKIFFK